MGGILEFLLKNNRWAILLVILLLLIGGTIISYKNNRINNFKNKYNIEVKLNKALVDSVDIFQNNEGDWVAEKLTIQTKIKNLEKMNGQLTVNQKKLLERIKVVDKENSIISAALIHANFIIDSLMHGGIVVIDTTNKTINFIETENPNIKYNFLASGVLPFPVNGKPTLLINDLILPNEQFIEFHWVDDKNEGNPIAFSITNSNKYVNVYDVNSYAIPTLNPDVLNPTNWQKINLWIKKNDGILKFVGGIGAGAGAMFIMMK